MTSLQTTALKRLIVVLRDIRRSHTACRSEAQQDEVESARLSVAHDDACSEADKILDALLDEDAAT